MSENSMSEDNMDTTAANGTATSRARRNRGTLIGAGAALIVAGFLSVSSVNVSALISTTTTVAPTTTVPPTTTTTVVVDDGGDILFPIERNGGLAAGKSKVTVDGAAASVNVTTQASSKTMKGQGFEAMVKGLDQDRKDADLDSQGRVVLTPGGYVSVKGEGFAPSKDLYVYLLSDPVLLGMPKASADGKFGLTMIVPDDVKPGVHTVQINGFTADGKVRSVNLGVVVADGAITSSVLPATK